MSKYPGRIITDLAPAGYSVYFDGTGDTLAVPNNAAFAMGTGVFTIEFWFYTSSITQTGYILETGGGSTSLFVSFASSTLRLTDQNTVYVSTPTLVANTWYHIAVVRSGTGSNQTVIYTNGVAGTAGTCSQNFTQAAPVIGGNSYVGYISNLRMVKGTAIYTAAFTPPTQLLNITNTSLLTCNSPAIVDQSSNAFAITVNGNAAVSTVTPFTAYVPYNPALGASTPGVWTVDEAMQAKATRRWNMYDPYFNLTTLLLHGNGTNAAQNNTFLDSSTNNFTITRNGNTTQGTFSPFSQTGWSNYFDGSGDYLSAAYNSAFAFPGDFTIEFWVNWSAHGSSAGFVTNMQSSGGAPAGWQIIFNGANDTVSLEVAGSYPFITSSSTLPKNTWAHVAVVRSGSATNNVKMYFDGVQVAQGTNTSTLDSTNASLFIGCERTGGAFITGYMSNVRIVKGTAVYTSAFTPPTSPLTAITNTQLLTCQSNRFIDNSTNAFTITVNGNPSVQAFSPFFPTTAYDAATVGGSAYFDGTGDYLTSASLAALGTGNFTFECWCYPTSTSSFRYLFSIGGDSNFTLALDSGTYRPYFYVGTTIISSSVNLIGNQWNHVALVRAGTGANQTTLYVNGVSGGSATFSTSIAAGIGYIAAQSTGSYTLTGYLSNLRLTNTAVYTAAFTPPTAPLTSVSGTQLLLNFTNAGITDATSKNVLETVGNAQISTTQSKWGGSSMYFDGTGDYLVAPDTTLMEFGSGNFTVEAWVRFNTLPSNTGIQAIVYKWDGSTQKSWAMYIYNNAGTYQFYFTYTTNGSTNVNPVGNVTISTNTWYHFAVSRSGADLKLFLDGTQVGSTHNIGTSSIFGGTAPITVGAYGSGTDPLNGYIDDLRITNGYARYTTSFVPPTSALQQQ